MMSPSTLDPKIPRPNPQWYAPVAPVGPNYFTPVQRPEETEHESSTAGKIEEEMESEIEDKKAQLKSASENFRADPIRTLSPSSFSR